MRYHFDLHEEDASLDDPTGHEMRDLANALAHARRILCDVARDGVGTAYRVVIRDPTGVVGRVDLRCAVSAVARDDRATPDASVVGT